MFVNPLCVLHSYCVDVTKICGCVPTSSKANSGIMPGYDAQFTSPLDKAFECPVCLIALRDPMQITPCGHRVCNTCLQPILRWVMYSLRRENASECMNVANGTVFFKHAFSFFFFDDKRVAITDQKRLHNHYDVDDYNLY